LNASRAESPRKDRPHPRRAYYQAAIVIIRLGQKGPVELVELYNRVRSKKGHKVTAVALAGKFVTISYHVLTGSRTTGRTWSGRGLGRTEGAEDRSDPVQGETVRGGEGLSCPGVGDGPEDAGLRGDTSRFKSRPCITGGWTIEN